MTARHCYLSSDTLSKLLDDSKVINAIATRLDVPGHQSSEFKRKPAPEALLLIDHQIEHFRNTESSRWSKSTNRDILSAAIFDSDQYGLTASFIQKTFGCVSEESELVGPIRYWLETKGLHAHTEISLGNKRADVVGYYNTPPKKSAVAIELKNDMNQLDRAINQIHTFQEYVEIAYLACTPWFAANYLFEFAKTNKKYNAKALEMKLESLNIGLLIVDGEYVDEIITPKKSKIKDVKFDELILKIKTRIFKG